ncbi:MAG TPA: PilN domain-containing protein [Syntrophorhabdaceae bacterium]|nr:PilN domain-containing protein [Syntrophorhabdaceae bacterium]HPU30211.1 PilN domain-containing protein [Syntrophorhabdaceae bacterium]
MIKINLIPTQEEKKLFKEDIYLFIFFVFLNAIAVCGFYYKNHLDIIEQKKIIDNTKKEIASLQSIYKEYLAMEQQKKEIERRMKAIDGLKEGRALTARILYDLTNIIKENVWLRSLKKADNKLNIEGVSIENESISDLMEKLVKIPYIKNVELVNITDELDKETNVTVKKFIIQGDVSF